MSEIDAADYGVFLKISCRDGSFRYVPWRTGLTLEDAEHRCFEKDPTPDTKPIVMLRVGESWINSGGVLSLTEAGDQG